MWAVHKSKANRCVTDAVDREVYKLVVEKQVIASARAAPVGIEALPALLAGAADMAAARWRRRLSTERKWQVACFGLPVSRVSGGSESALFCSAYSPCLRRVRSVYVSGACERPGGRARYLGRPVDPCVRMCIV